MYIGHDENGTVNYIYVLDNNWNIENEIFRRSAECLLDKRSWIKKKHNGANFRHLQSMAELRRNQRGEIRRQHVKAHSCSHFSPCFDHTSPTQTDDGTSLIDHDIGTYVTYSFPTMSRVLLCPLPTEVQGWRRQGQRLNVTAQWRDHLNWERGFTASMISPVI